jgi:LacI family transcriptional regulator
MQGESPPPEPVLIAPRKVVSRQSTDTLAIEDPDVARVIHFIRQHACSGITMEDVLRQAPLARVTLKRRFERVLGRSPKAEIMRLQLERVKQLLVETDLSQAAIARLAGFRHVEYMSTTFHERTGQTPRQYRLSCCKRLSLSDGMDRGPAAPS